VSKEIKEANIISWKLVIDENNNIITEISQFPEEMADEIFQIDAPTIKAILRIAKLELDKVHNLIEANLNARRMKDK